MPRDVGNFKSVSLALGVLAFWPFIQSSSSLAANASCWVTWTEQQLKYVPKAGDTINPRTGKELSQTDGAKRTRALKYQAAKDALELRGKESPDWKSFAIECESR